MVAVDYQEHPLGSPLPRPAPVAEGPDQCRGREFSRHQAVLRLPGNQEVQALCSRLPEPLSRIHPLPELYRIPAAHRGPGRQDRGEGNRRGHGHDRRRGPGILPKSEADRL